MKKLRNPFLLTGFYAKEYFCDREQEIQILKEHFNNERNVVLYSWRRMGKTALIKQLINHLENEKLADTVYVDLLGTRDIEAALIHITQAVYNRFGKTGSGISSAFQRLLGGTGVELSFDPYTGLPNFSIGLRNRAVTERSLDAIGTFLNGRKKQVLIVLDEFQQITGYNNSNGEAIFRSWMQSFPGLRFIFSGSHRHMMVSMFSERNRPFYRSAQLLQLNPIMKESYEGFILDHFHKSGKVIDKTIIEDIFKWSRMQTYCIQLICNRLFGQYNNARQEDLKLVFNEILDQEGPVFSGYTKLLTKMQWNVMLAVAKEEPLVNPLSKEFVQKHQLGAFSSVSTALNMLQKNELIIEEEGTYYVHDVLLSRWLQSI